MNEIGSKNDRKVTEAVIVLMSLLFLTSCSGFFEAILGLGKQPEEPPVSSFIVHPSSGASVGDVVILNGSTSSDPQGHSLSYDWSLAGPTDSQASLYPDYGPLVSFQADKPGSYVVVLTVTAESKTATSSKTIDVLGAASGIASFGFVSLPAMGVIDESANTITVTVPSGTDVTTLVARFTTKAASVTVNGVAQTSGITSHDFTAPVRYLVTADDGSTLTYEVSVVPSSTDPIVGKWQLDTMNEAAASTIPMAMNLSLSSDASWLAIGSQPGEPMVTYGSWSAQSGGTYTMTFTFGGPIGVSNMSMSLVGSTLTGTFTDADGQKTLVFIPGTAILPDPIIGDWHLSSATPPSSSAQAMNFTFNSDNTWSMSGVQATSSISASGTWSQGSPGSYTVDYDSGGPTGVSSIPFTLGSGALTGTFITSQVQTTWILLFEALELPASINPLPSIFMTKNGDYAQVFKNQAWRLGPAADGDPWAAYTYMSFEISDDGAHYTEYLAGIPGNSGFLNWHMSGAEQKLDFLDSKNQALYSFTVLDHSANHLHLRMPYGDGAGAETREWILSAGTANLCGLVVVSPGTLISNYWYELPLSGASVQFGTYETGSTPIAGMVTTTDSRGYFEFSDLSAYVGQAPWVKVTKTGYAENTAGDPKNKITSVSPVFLSVGLSASNP